MHGLGGLWALGFLIGAILVGAALVWGIVSYGRRNRRNEPITDAATRANYENTDTYGDKEAALRRQTRP